MSAVPDELADVVRRAASGTADYVADASGIERRWRRRRRRRLAACAVGVVALLLVSFGAVSALTGGPRTPDGGHSFARSGHGQRLMIQGYRAVRQNSAVPASAYTSHGVAGLAGAALEVRADGTVAHWRLRSDMTADQVIGLADGRVAVLGSVGSGTGTSGMLTVLMPTGEVELARSIDDGVPARLIGATSEAAYLWRSRGLVAHDLRTGAERVVATADELGGAVWSAGQGDADISGELLLTSGANGDPCRLRTVDLRTGATARHPVTQGPCATAWQVRLAPDRRSAAVTYLPSAEGPLRLAVVDLASGIARLDQEIRTPGNARLGFAPVPVGLAWSGPTQVRVAVAAAPDTKRVYPLQEVLHVRTFEVG